jgi:hypothetical protein
MELNTKMVFPFVGTEIENFPSASDTEPFVEFLIVMLAPETAAPDSFDSTRPVI